MEKLFISHSSEDDGFVREMRLALADHGQTGWIDSRELRGGDPLWTEIVRAIEEASAYAVVVSPEALQSKWVSKELRHALEVQKQRGIKTFPVIPLSLNGTKLGVLKEFFSEEPVYLSACSSAGGVEAAMHVILVALGKRLPAEVAPTPQPIAEPLEELVLELTDLKFYEKEGLHRASARARLVYEPATPGQPNVYSAQSWRLIAPIDPIEAGELRWYLEQYAIWPSHYFRDRAKKVETDLVKWGKLLHEAAMPVAHTANVMQAWATIGHSAVRRFSVYIDTTIESGAPAKETETAREAGTSLLGLPWELLHDGESYLFQGARPTRVRRRLPNTKAQGVLVVATPIRILLVTARPEDDSCGYIDHRASALPLVEAMESLPGLVKLHVLNPPTLPALCAELDRARDENTPYHVVHFDGHGIYDRRVGLGGLCFEKPEDSGKLENRRHDTVFTNDLGPLLRDHRIPLVFLDACQSGKAEQASESVASGLLKVGVASVVAMSHSVLVETARRFVEAFYKALAEGKRVGNAMLAGQRYLKDDSFRGRIFGAGELRLEDWFVPVLFQEKSDPQLFTTAPARQTQDDFKAALTARLGELPLTPETGFIGRSRELLALQRLLRSGEKEQYAVVRGQGGEGKTALAAEFARWMVRSHQLRRAAFVSVELYGHAGAVLDALGRQLVGQDYSVATFENLEKAILPVERALREQPTLLVIDNMESILLPPFLADEASEALSEEAKHELEAILQLCQRLNGVGETRLIFTSREALPAPFDAVQNQRLLHQLDREDAVKLVERTLTAAGGEAGASGDAAREEIEQLVEAAHCNSRMLVLLAPALQKRGVESTRKSLVLLMAEMEKKYPGSREHSLFASVELSLRRMSKANRERVRVLGVFHGGVSLTVLHFMMEWEMEVVALLATELVNTGLATPNLFTYFTLNPALSPYLASQMEVAEREALIIRWVKAMHQYIKFLEKQRSQNTGMAATLTLLELPNLFRLLDLVQQAGNAEATIDLSTTICSLLQRLGKPRLLERAGKVRDTAATAMESSWNHAQFEAARSRIEQQLDSGRLDLAFYGAQSLLNHARAAGEKAYPDANYDLATTCWLMVKLFNKNGKSEQALALLDEARLRFESIAKEEVGVGAEKMVSNCFTEQGNSLFFLGRLDEAAAAYEEAIRRSEQRGAERDIAVGKGLLGNVRIKQRRYPEALQAYDETRDRFNALGEPDSIAMILHQVGMVYQEMGIPEAAEDAYRQSLAIDERLHNFAGQAATLLQLGNLYGIMLDRQEDAAFFFRHAVKNYVDSGNVIKEGYARNNLANTLCKLGRLKEARLEILQAIECNEQSGHASELWTTWDILADIETDSGNPSAAADAKHKAIDSYLDYRRNGGENHDSSGRVCFAITNTLLVGDIATAETFLKKLVDGWKAAGFSTFVPALQAIVTGRRDRTLANDPDLTYAMAAEILLLIETLENRGL